MKEHICALFLSQLITVCIIAQTNDTQLLFEKYANRITSHQSAACYGDYLVLVSDSVVQFSLYNLKTKQLLCTNYQSAQREKRNGMVIYHANNSSFGRVKYDKHDVFPLLYVSHRENNELRGVLEVYRIIPFPMNNGYDSIAIKRVQTIYYPKMTDENALGSPWTVIAPDGKFMYSYSRNNRKGAKNYGMCRISKFRVPKVKGRSDSIVYLEDKDIIDGYTIADYKIGLSQGACIYRHRMYIGQGIPRVGGLYVRVIDLKKKRLIITYDLQSNGFNEEPEGCFIYGQKLMLSTTKKNIYLLNIPLNK